MGAIGVIGGTGLYEMEGLTQIEEVDVQTPFGRPSDRFVTGRFNGRRMVFLSRHGRGHRVAPSQIPFRANIWGMKKLGVDWLISVSAVGSMREDIQPGHLVMVDQFFDWTRGIRPKTFFDEGLAVHIEFADPICQQLQGYLVEAASQQGITHHRGGTYLCIEGPQFSTRGESRIYRSWGVDVIGMTNMPEAKLAREAEISYATIALATDYDCWHESEEDVSVESILLTLRQNVENAKKVIRAAVPRIPVDQPCPYHNALQYAIVTGADLISQPAKERLALLIGKYLEEPK